MGLVEKKSYLNIQIGPTKGIHTRIIENPGRWMSQPQLDKLVDDLRTVMFSLKIGELDYGIFTGSKDALDRGVITIIYRGKEKKPLAFNSMAWMNCQLRGQITPVLHLGLTIIDPKEQAQGFTWTLYGLSTALLLLRNRLRPFWMSNVTQVPVVLGKVTENFSEVYPNAKGVQRRTYDHLLLARQIIKDYRHVFGVGEEAIFDEDRFIIMNSYTGGSDHLKKTFESCPKHRIELYNQLCQEQLDYARGDDFLQLGKVDLNTIFQYVFRSIPAIGILQFLTNAILIILRTWIAPTLQWFSTNKTFKELRPR